MSGLLHYVEETRAGSHIKLIVPSKLKDILNEPSCELQNSKTETILCYMMTVVLG